MKKFFYCIIFLLALTFNSLSTFGQKDSLNHNCNEISIGTNISPWGFPSPLLKKNTGYMSDDEVGDPLSYYFHPHFYYKILTNNKRHFVKIGASIPGYLFKLGNLLKLDYADATVSPNEKDIDFGSSVSWGKNKINNKKSSFYINKELITALKLYKTYGGNKWSSWVNEGILYRIGGGISYGFLFKLSKLIDMSLEQSFYINYSYLNYNYTSSQTTIIFMDTLARQETTYKQGTEIKHYVDFAFYKFLTLNCTFKLYGKEND